MDSLKPILCNKNDVFMGMGYKADKPLIIPAIVDNFGSSALTLLDSLRWDTSTKCIDSMKNVLVVGNSPTCCKKPDYYTTPSHGLWSVLPLCYNFESVSSYLPLGATFFENNIDTLRCVSMFCREPALHGKQLVNARHLYVQLSDWVKMEVPPHLDQLWLEVDINCEFQIPETVRELVLRESVHSKSVISEVAQTIVTPHKTDVVVYTSSDIETLDANIEIVIVDNCEHSYKI